MYFVIPKVWKMFLWAREAQFHSQLDIIVPDKRAKSNAVLLSPFPIPNFTLSLKGDRFTSSLTIYSVYCPSFKRPL